MGDNTKEIKELIQYLKSKNNMKILGSKNLASGTISCYLKTNNKCLFDISQSIYSNKFVISTNDGSHSVIIFESIKLIDNMLIFDNYLAVNLDEYIIYRCNEVI